MGLRANIDLEPVHQRTVSRLLDRHVRGLEVWAYGSRVDWTSHPASDLDLVIFASSDQESDVIRLREALDESSLPFRVDVHIWDRLPDSFHERITQDYVVLRDPYSSEQAKSTHVESLLGDFAPLAYGKSLPASKRKTEGNVPVYGSNGIVGYHDTALSEGPTVIVGRKGTVGAVHYSSIPCWPIDTTFYCEGADNELVRFRYYALKSLQLDKMNSDSAVPGLNRNHAHSLKLPVPPEHEQRTIAGFLGALDDKIELNRRTSETLEVMARALFRSWFVDFDPVRAKTEGRPSGLPPDLDILFPAAFEESELGEIPEGWHVCNLDDIADFTNGLALQRFPPDGEDGLPVIKIAEMRQGFTHKTAKASSTINSRYIVEDGDMLFSWSGSLQVVLWSHGRGALNQHLFRVTSDKFPQWFYWGWTIEHLEDFRSIAAGKATTMGHIQRHHLTNAKVIIPPMEVLRAAGGFLATLIDRQVDSAVQSRGLVAQRDSLLPRLLSGMLRVADTKQPVRVTA